MMDFLDSVADVLWINFEADNWVSFSGMVNNIVSCEVESILLGRNFNWCGGQTIFFILNASSYLQIVFIHIVLLAIEH